MSVSLSRIPPLPPVPVREDHPAVEYWTKEDYYREESRSAGKGESNGKPTEPEGNTRPRTESDSTKKRPHYYLQHHDGTPVSKAELTSLSCKARSLWMTLKEQGTAPKTFSKISSNSWEFFLRVVVANPDFEFLRWCDDGEWKLREWATQNYSSWALNARLRDKTRKQTQPKIKDDNALNDSSLIRMSPVSCQNEDGGNDEEVLGSRICEANLDSVNGGRDPDGLTQGTVQGIPSSETPLVRQSPLDYSAR